MVKIILIYILLSSVLFSENIYEKNCIPCHKKLPTSLQGIFMNYLVVYGGEENMKAGLKHYLSYPSKEISTMSKLFIKKYGIKDKTTLTSKQIDEALDIYWNQYKVFGKLK